jgi:acyl carrier protein
LNGKLFVTGRVKDVIILRGRNHYPQDIEASIKSATENLLGQVVAVSDAGPNGESFAIVAEMARTTPDDQIPEIIRRIRRSVIEEHEIDPRRVILVRTASIPVTTSGKLQRSATRDLLVSEKLIVRGSWYRSDVRVDGEPLPIPELPSSPSAEQKTQVSDSIERWMLSWLMVRGGVEAADLDADKSLDQLGLDSLSAVEMSGEIEDWLGLRLTPIVAYEHPTPRKLADHLAEQWLAK